MPLPTDNIPWPPKDTEAAQKLYREWGAWYTGDPDQLSDLYGAGGGGALDLKQYNRPGQYRGGVVGKVSRWFWGAPLSSGQLRNNKLHVPLASDIAETSADLLFAEPPQFHVARHKPTQARVDTLVEDMGLLPLLLETGETCSGYGGVYLRVTVDETLAAYPIPDAVPADCAVPEFRRGRLSGVTFWRVLDEGKDGREVWRHLERHEPGRVYHGLYKGTGEKLGMQMPLEEREATKPFAAQVDDEGGIDTGVKGLSVVYVPNMRPNRLLRGSPLGRSDYSGVTPLLDGLDETWSSWMRDLRLAKGRIIVPSPYLDDLGAGKGTAWDAEREVYEALNMPPNTSAGLTINQFAIRVAEHQSTVDALTNQIVRSAGYSMQTFGGEGDDEARVMTATEARARANRSFTTRGRKINYWKPALRELWNIVLQVDAATFRSRVKVAPMDVEFPDGTADHPEVVARTIQLVAAAQAASIQTKVAMLHPDWDDTEIAAEADRIRAELGLSVPDPITLGRGEEDEDQGDGADGDEQPDDAEE